IRFFAAPSNSATQSLSGESENESTSSHAKTGHKRLNLGQYYYRANAADLLFAGAVFLLALLILLIYIKSKDRIYLYYFLFLALTFWGTLINTRAYSWDDGLYYQMTAFSYKLLELTTLLALTFYCLFTIKLLSIKEHDPKLARWIKLLAGVTAVYGIF